MLVFAVPPLQAASPNLIREMFRVVWRREGWPMGDMDFERWNWLVEIVSRRSAGVRFSWKNPCPASRRRIANISCIIVITRS